MRPSHPRSVRSRHRHRRQPALLVKACAPLGLALALLTIPTGASADTFTVTTPDDVVDGQCDSTHCSLREALIASATQPGPDTIVFNLGGPGPHTIAVSAPLPTLTDGGTVIDGTTQPGYAGVPRIIVQPGYPPPPGQQFTGGLTIASAGNVVRGLSLVGFQFTVSSGLACGSTIAGGGGVVLLSGSGNLIEDNYLGVTPSGSAQGNTVGAYLHLNAWGNTIRNNVISGNECGLMLLGNEQTIQDNRIGTDPSGTAAVGNTRHGIQVLSYNNLIGGPGHGNLISGNTGTVTTSAIFIATSFGSPSGNVVQGNRIGTDLGGSAPIPNTRGIFFIDGEGSLIGGLGSGEGNRVAFNVRQGIEVEGNGHVVAGNEVFQNGLFGVEINGITAITRNSIYDNADVGIDDVPGGATLPPSLGSPTSSSIFGQSCPGCVVEVFLAAPDPTGAGEGKEFLGAATAGINGMFSLDLPIGLEACDPLTATATDGRPRTSVFAQNVYVKPCLLLDGWKFPLLVLLFPFLIGPGVAILTGRGRRPPGRTAVRGGLFGALGGLALGAVLLALPPVHVSWPRPAAHPPEPGTEQDESFPGVVPAGLQAGEPTATETPYLPSGIPPTPTLMRAAITLAATPEPVACVYTAKVNLFCRSGPGGDYKDVDGLLAGQQAPVVGESTDGNYWYVRGPNTGGVCTLPQAERFGEVRGDCAAMPVFTPAPLPTKTLTPTPTPVGAFGGG